MPYILALLALLLHLVLAIVLIRKYLRTRDVGFIWLGVAVVIWPLVSRLLDRGKSILIDRVLRGELIGFYPFNLIEREQITIGSLVASLSLVQQLIGVGLLLVAVLYLCKAKNNNLHATG